MRLNRLITPLAVAGLFSALTTRAELIVVTNDIAAGTTVTWRATNSYLLNTIVYVQTNATLIIEPGTVIRGGTNAASLIAKPGIPNLVSALWVTRGAKIMAQGTREQPIIFTMEGDDVNNPHDIPPTVTGKWGGLIVMGRATINSAFDIAGNGATPVTDVYEGVTSEGPNGEHRFGGSDDADSSGVLRYVSIRHTGSQFAQDRELNSLSMGGVGSGTVIEYIESFASSDDAFEWWGGTASARYLVAAFCEDDDFDTDQGYHGATNQFWFGIKPPWQGSADSRGFETDGDTSQTILGDRQPFSQWTVHNVTLIGRGKDNVSFGGGTGWNARDEAAPNVFNTVFAEFNKGILLDTDGLHHWTNNPVRADARNNVWDVRTNSANANGLFLFTEAARTNTVEAALLGGISYTNNAGLDPRPQSGSPLLANVRAGAPTSVNYRGAFSGPSDNWADGWTLLSSAGYLKSAATPPPPSNVVTVTNDIASGTTVTWRATNSYLLNTIVYVQTNATLIIEPGTVIRGGTNAANLIAKPGIPNLVSALWVTRGAKIMAQGTREQPIIFTMEGDDVNNPHDIPPTVTGKWGGLIVMGRATINSAFDIAGNGATPVTDVYEGVTSEGPNGEHRFGGSDDADSSGVLRYVSIRHTGSQFAQDRELNSLSMGGVGSGTVIEYIESFASSDDAFEWWGGTASARYLVAAFCEDDDFDTDQGYHGATNQFWFGIKPPWQGSADSRGFETDGDTSQTILGDRQPFSQWTVHNVTLIGRGKDNVSFGGGTGWNARDEAAPNVFNTVFAEFNKGILLDTDGLHHWTNNPVRADARNNVWDVRTNSANANGLFLFTEAARTNTVEAALLGGISYTNNAGLDPRPQSGSPLLANVRPGAPTPVNYRGAFSGPSDNWADGWTLLSSAGYLKAATSGPPELAAALSNGTIRISFETQAGATYQVQSKTDLGSATWTDEGGPVTGIGGTSVFTASVNDAAQKFFRVIVR